MENQPELTSNRDVAKGRLCVLSVPGRTLSIFFQHPLLFLFLAMLESIPFEWWMSALMPEESTLSRVLTIFLSDIVMRALVLGSISYAAYKTIRNEGFSFSEILGRGLSGLLPMVLTLILLIVVIGVCLMLNYFVVLCTGFFIRPLADIFSTVTGFSSLFILFAPSILFPFKWVFVPQICCIEKIWALDSLNLSSHLTDGHFWRILGLFLLLAVGLLLFCLALGVLITFSASPAILAETVTTVLVIPLTAFIYIMLTVLYADLRFQ